MGVEVLGFLIFAAAMVGTPGPANMVLLSAGARFGLRRALPFVTGVLLGKQLIIWPIGFGLIELADRVPSAFAALKWASVAYILWLAWRIAGSSINTARQTKVPGFFAGLIVHPLNPKAWAMIMVGFTSFVAEGTSALIATTVIALSLMSVQLVLHPLWTLGGRAIAARMAGQRSEKYLMRVLAGLTVASVLLVLMKEG
ncbi:lysine transporter LysE [Rhodobacterales bacterium 52_120_T64]|nr:lysine transporter LysE [Rhodobacterales bacterium 52_120_T64]